MPLIDETTEFGRRVRRRLQTEPVIWLTTQGRDGTPQPSPVWFLPTEADEIIIYSQRDKPKVRNITARPTVALHFNATRTGDDVVILHGEARVDHDAPAANTTSAYAEKYGVGIAELGMTPESFAAEYSVPIRVALTRLRGF